MIEYCQKYDGKRTFDIFYSEDDKPKSGEEEDSQDHKRVASPIKSDFIIEESTNHQKRFKYTQVVIDFISDEIRTFKALKEAVPKVKEFLEHKVGKLDACDEYDQFIRLLESSINAIISKLLKLTGLSKLKQDYSDLMKLNVFQLVYNARLDRFDLGYILSEIFFQNSNLESLFLSDDEIQPLLKLPLVHVSEYASKFQDLINSSGQTFPSHGLSTCLTKVNALKAKCETMAKIQMIKKDFKINDVSDLEKVGHIVKCIFTKEKQPKRYDDFENKTPEDFKMSGYKTKEVNASSKRSIHAKLPSINKLFSTLPPIHAPNNGTSQMLFKSALVQQFKYKYYHLKSFRNSMYMHSINLVKFLEVQIQYCEHWQALLEDNDVSVDARYIKSMYSSFHSKLVNQLKYSHESIITTIQRVVIPALDSGLKACKQFNDKLNRYYNIKDHENGTTLAKLHDELQHHIPPFIHQLDQLVELSLMKFHTAYCRWNETIIGNRSLDEYRKLSSKEKSSGEKHDDICKYYKSVAPPIT